MAVKKIVRHNKRRVGRPTEVGADMAIGIRLPAKLLDELDAWAEASKVSRSEAIRELIEMSLETLRKRGKR
jgi:metal-responsive CopG/Arc/MetJ family transcriptional regulator